MAEARGLRGTCVVSRETVEPGSGTHCRVFVPHFGVPAYGVHMNGYVRKSDGIHMWIGRRAKESG